MARANRKLGVEKMRFVPMLSDMTLESYLDRQIEWSKRTFGSGKRTKGIVEHIRSELNEITEAPQDLREWVDVMILALDGYWRHGGTPETLMDALIKKQNVNFARAWPTPVSEDIAVEHQK
jgi:hypothetical protein